MTTEVEPNPPRLLTNPKALFALLRDTVKAWQADKASRLAAALAYYTIFSMAPLLVLGVSVLSLAMGREEARAGITSQIASLAGPAAAAGVETIAGVEDGAPNTGSVWLTVISAITLLLGASGVFGQLQDALNTIWGISARPEEGIMALIRSRFLAFAMILVIGFLLVVSLLLSTVLGFFTNRISERVPEVAFFLPFVDFAVSFAITTLLFALIYRLLPSVKIAWRDVWIGAAITSLLFNLGKIVIGFYLGQSDVGSAFGAAGSLVILLLWIYYSAQIFLLGAEFTFVYANQYGSRIQPAAHAVFLEPPSWQPDQYPVPPSNALPAAHHPWYKTYGLILFGFLLGLIAGAARQINQENSRTGPGR